MFRKRFPIDRVARVVGVTGASIAWAAAIATQAIGSPSDSATVEEPIALTDPVATTGTPASETTVAVPDLPREGLTVVRVAVSPAPEPAAAPRRTTQVSDGAGTAAPPPATMSPGAAPAPAAAPAPVAAPAPAPAPPPPASSGGS